MSTHRRTITAQRSGLRRRATTSLALVALACVTVTPLAAQSKEQADTVKRDQGRAYLLDPVNVTATRSEKRIFETPAPVSVFDRDAIRDRAPNTVSDLFRGLAGLDVTGVGTNQVRPVIRGQRGQRLLLVQDGMRLNNTRRQQDFGELLGLIDVAMVERVEVVRGPASVLYGSDAIGGAVNVITRTPERPGLHGSAAYRFSSPDNQNRLAATVAGRFGRFGVLASGSLRRTDPYDAPAGSFGEIALAGDTRVEDTGVEDQSAELFASYDIAARQQVSLRFSHYAADNAGFGFVDPEAYAPELPEVRILYPFQRFNKISATYDAAGVRTAIADRLQVLAYFQDNERRLDNNILVVPFPGASIDVRSENFTDIQTSGARLEAAKLIGGRVLLTYGTDIFQDRAANTDNSTETLSGFGPPPPIVTVDSTPNLPTARYRSFGVFAQGELSLGARSSITVGLRYQNTNAARALLQRPHSGGARRVPDAQHVARTRTKLQRGRRAPISSGRRGARGLLLREHGD
jgi:hemoglobin/transferrin/lactoferrin receptor protein